MCYLSGCETKSKQCQIVKLAEKCADKLMEERQMGQENRKQVLGYNSTQNY